MFCKIKLKLNGKEIVLNTMVDTGNMLKEPISGIPVIVVEHTKLYNVIPKEILNNIEAILGGDFNKIPDKKRIYVKIKTDTICIIRKTKWNVIRNKSRRNRNIRRTNKPKERSNSRNIQQIIN